MIAGRRKDHELAVSFVVYRVVTFGAKDGR